MAIYENDGTASHQIGKVYDNDGTVSHQIGKVYDNDGTASILIYTAEDVIVENSYAVISSGSFVKDSKAKFSLIPANGSNAKTALIDLTNYNTVHIEVIYTSGHASSIFTCGVYKTMGIWNAVKEVNGIVTNGGYSDNAAFAVGDHTFKADLDVSSLSGTYYIGCCSAGGTYRTETCYAEFTKISLS